MNVELRHLRALAAIGDHGNISEAAFVLGVSQPALSRTLDQLERRLGVCLVERTTRSLTLTAPGRRLWERAHRVLVQVEEAVAEVAHGTGPLRVGFAWGALGRHTVALLRSWDTDVGECPLRVRRGQDPLQALGAGQVDVGFVRTLPEESAGLVARALYREPRVVAVAEGTPLAQAESLRLAQVAEHTVALCSTAATTGSELWPSGQRPHTVEVANVEEWLTLIATGAAVGVTASGSAYSHPHPEVRYLPLADADPVTVSAVLAAEPGHPRAEEFAEFARRFLADQGMGL
ncbi:LysR family transcriptional regulator [Nocardiopsis oceani]